MDFSKQNIKYDLVFIFKKSNSGVAEFSEPQLTAFEKDDVENYQRMN